MAGVRERLIKVGKTVRAKMEEVAKEEDFPRDLSGLCARASAELMRDLQQQGFKPRMFMCDGHAHIYCSGYRVDVTATQFRGSFKNPFVPKVLVKRWGELKQMLKYDLEYWTKIASFASVDSVLKYQKKEGWPSDQRVRKVELPKRKRRVA